MKTVNLYELEALHHTIRVTKDGPAHAVRPVTGRITGVVLAAEAAEGHEKLRLYYEAVRLLVPTLGDEVLDLTPKQIGQVLALANTQVEAVEEAAASPNAASPASESPSGVTSSAASS
jgi:hypothetical protein